LLRTSGSAVVKSQRRTADSESLVARVLPSAVTAA
jgi:hypothetical protein